MLLRQFTDQFTDLNNLLRVKTYGRLVEYQHLGIPDQRLSQTHTLLVALGKAADEIISQRKELEELRAYKTRMEMQYLDDIGNLLEPLKLQSALESEIFKYNYRKEHKPQDINILDYTVMAALKDCLERQVEK